MPSASISARLTTPRVPFWNSDTHVVEMYDGANYVILSRTLEIAGVLTTQPVVGVTAAGIYIDFIGPYNLVYWTGQASITAYPFASAPDFVRTAAGDVYRRGASGWTNLTPEPTSLIQVGRTGTDQAGVTAGVRLIFNVVTLSRGSNITYDPNTGIFTLKKGLIYRLTGAPSFANFVGGGWLACQWEDTAGTALDARSDDDGISISAASGINENNQNTAFLLYAPQADMQVVLKCFAAGATAVMRGNGPSRAVIEQV